MILCGEFTAYNSEAVCYNERKRAGTGEACSSRTAKLLSELCSRYNRRENKNAANGQNGGKR